ncbi:hypothetical protein B9G69_012585 [Bdellovibrio sp. SKB1291214]|uniref:DUF2614 family zinc ribbon-containing protein n=1 Tax=Bdellovibrio sp. SKB1291214 TaxID=1732569 RepID=UPI000B51AF6C|nr:DUF2614 family zinc ribbon-containing protein [Bdellovibrio sp. SKB1291214]UYL07883.1 hypothetical protein B9G69_012585 [Bdellovibrio sp. SKB1291214]
MMQKIFDFLFVWGIFIAPVVIIVGLLLRNKARLLAKLLVVLGLIYLLASSIVVFLIRSETQKQKDAGVHEYLEETKDSDKD